MFIPRGDRGTGHRRRFSNTRYNGSKNRKKKIFCSPRCWENVSVYRTAIFLKSSRSAAVRAHDDRKTCVYRIPGPRNEFLDADDELYAYIRATVTCLRSVYSCGFRAIRSFGFFFSSIIIYVPAATFIPRFTFRME